MSDAQPIPRIRVSTVWIWLLIVLPIVGTAAEMPFAAALLHDYFGSIGDALSTAGTNAADSAAVSQAVRTAILGSIAHFAGAMLLVNVVGLVGEALTVVLAWLDWRALKARGILRPFHWAWAFLAFAGVGNLVYVIGRLVISRRRGGAVSGLVAAFVVVAVVMLVGGIVFGVIESAQVLQVIRDAAQHSVNG